MKKLSILALAALLVVMFTLPAMALENEFGGYWRTRFYSQKNFTGYDRSDDLGVDDTVELTDTRTRLYYTAKINDNLKLVNKFEMDAVWGSNDQSRNAGAATNRGYGQVGADGANIEIKNTYADFNLGPVNATVGVQPFELFRGFHISEDASGIIARWKAMDNLVLAGSWLKFNEGSRSNASQGNSENEDIDVYTVASAINFSENMVLKPAISTTYSEKTNSTIVAGILGNAAAANEAFGELYIVSYGADFDMTFDKWGAWVTAYGQTGELEGNRGANGNTSDTNFRGFIAAAGANFTLTEIFELHGEGFYAPGDGADDPVGGDYSQLVNTTGSYYWSEIMGYGTFDNIASAGSPADKINNIWAINFGTTITPMEKLKITADIWYAELDEQNANGDDELGTEIDLKISYQLIEGLNLDLIGAYLFAEDATAAAPGLQDNQEDPYEFGARLSLSF